MSNPFLFLIGCTYSVALDSRCDHDFLIAPANPTVLKILWHFGSGIWRFLLSLIAISFRLHRCGT